MIVVTGATGNVGQVVVRALAAKGEQVTAVARRRPAAALPDGVRFYAADLAEPEMLRAVVEGAEALFLLVAGDDPRGLLDAAKAGGVRRVVLLSSIGAGTRPEAYGHARSFEDAVRESGLEWTILRAGGFASNALAWAESIRAERTAGAPFGDVALPTVDPADVGEAAAVVLGGGGRSEGAPGNVIQTYKLTGPTLMTPRNQVREIAQVLGEDVRFVELSRADARARMLQFMPEAVVDGTLGILGEPTAEEQQVSGDLERILGRPANTFADWAARNAAAFR
ncbi:MAG TPA: NAD(P)H-binding protein [Actinocrinis sp.]|nr:NAD(P)H-binding protein [Actinocrinis sp.]